jgi:hypothetical protein
MENPRIRFPIMELVGINLLDTVGSVKLTILVGCCVSIDTEDGVVSGWIILDVFLHTTGSPGAVSGGNGQGTEKTVLVDNSCEVAEG